MKKSSTRSSRTERGHIDSALSTAWERDARVAATLFGEVGEASTGDSSFRFFIASACRFGGPRRRLGLSKVHGISRATQARHGGPDSSHCRKKQISIWAGAQLECRDLVPSLYARCTSRMLCANGLPFARLRLQAQQPPGPDTARADIGYCLPRGSRPWPRWGHYCRATAGKAEGRTGKAARQARRDARPAGYSEYCSGYAQTVQSQDEEDERHRGEEGNCPWASRMPTCLDRCTTSVGRVGEQLFAPQLCDMRGRSGLRP